MVTLLSIELRVFLRHILSNVLWNQTTYLISSSTNRIRQINDIEESKSTGTIKTSLGYQWLCLIPTPTIGGGIKRPRSLVHQRWRWRWQKIFTHHGTSLEETRVKSPGIPR